MGGEDVNLFEENRVMVKEIRGGSRAAATSKMERFVIMSQRMYFYSSKLRLIVTKGGANSADLDGLGFKLNL